MPINGNVPVVRSVLPPGDAGVDATVRKMAGMAFGQYGAKSAKIRALAIDIINRAGVQDKDYYGMIVAIHNWVRDSIRYVKDPIGQETLSYPEEIAFNSRAGDCLDENTRLMTPQGYVAIKDVQVGSTIVGKNGWTKVLKVWDKGALPTKAYHLSNGGNFIATDDHRCFLLQGGEVPAKDLKKGDALLGPPPFPLPEQPGYLSEDDCYFIGVYLADGWTDANRICIAGKDGFAKEAQKVWVKTYAEAKGWKTSWHPRYIRVYIPDDHPIHALTYTGKVAPEKDIPEEVLSQLTQTKAKRLLDGILSDSYDPSVSKREIGAEKTRKPRAGRGGMCYSTVSDALAKQVRLLFRVQGFSVKDTLVVNHGGLGKNPVHRIYPRYFLDKPAKVKEIVESGVRHVYDVETEDHGIYLPDADVVVHNCDDKTILEIALLAALGINAYPVVIGTVPGQFTHVYLHAKVPVGRHRASGQTIPLDPIMREWSAGREAPPERVKRKKLYTQYQNGVEGMSGEMMPGMGAYAVGPSYLDTEDSQAAILLSAGSAGGTKQVTASPGSTIRPGDKTLATTTSVKVGNGMGSDAMFSDGAQVRRPKPGEPGAFIASREDRYGRIWMNAPGIHPARNTGSLGPMTGRREQSMTESLTSEHSRDIPTTAGILRAESRGIQRKIVTVGGKDRSKPEMKAVGQIAREVQGLGALVRHMATLHRSCRECSGMAGLGFAWDGAPEVSSAVTEVATISWWAQFKADLLKAQAEVFLRYADKAEAKAIATVAKEAEKVAKEAKKVEAQVVQSPSDQQAAMEIKGKLDEQQKVNGLGFMFDGLAADEGTKVVGLWDNIRTWFADRKAWKASAPEGKRQAWSLWRKDHGLMYQGAARPAHTENAAPAPMSAQESLLLAAKNRPPVPAPQYPINNVQLSYKEAKALYQRGSVPYGGKGVGPDGLPLQVYNTGGSLPAGFMAPPSQAQPAVLQKPVKEDPAQMAAIYAANSQKNARIAREAKVVLSNIKRNAYTHKGFYIVTRPQIEGALRGMQNAELKREWGQALAQKPGNVLILPKADADIVYTKVQNKLSAVISKPSLNIEFSASDIDSDPTLSSAFKNIMGAVMGVAMSGSNVNNVEDAKKLIDSQTKPVSGLPGMGGLTDTLKSPVVLVGLAAAAAGFFMLRKKGK